MTELCCKADADGQLAERTQIIMLMRIAPKDFTDKLILDGVTVDKVADLDSRLNAYLQTACCEMDVVQRRSIAPM